MRGVLIGTDIVKDTDGLYKALETNTSIGISMDFNKYFDSGSFLEFLADNSIDSIHFIFNSQNTKLGGQFLDLEPQTQNVQKNIVYFLRDLCDDNGLTYTESSLEQNSVTIPVIEDIPNKLILRLSYDNTALIDDTYSKDNWEFLKLMYDYNPSSIPATYINDTELGFDSIGTTLRDNGNQPNYCIKKRITPADRNVFPKFLKITSLEQLESIKNSLEVDEYLQEFVYNPDETIENKLKHYRSVDLLYGGNLDSYNFFIQEVTNVLPIIETPDYDDNNEIQIWDRLRFVNKWEYDTKKIAVNLAADEGTKIVKPDNEIIGVESLNIGDSVKAISVSGLPEWLEGDESLLLWSASIGDVLSNSFVTSSVLEEKNDYPYFGEIIEITLENGAIFSDVGHAKILKQDEVSGSTIVRFENYEDLQINDSLLIWDNQTDSFLIQQITNLQYSYQSLNAYSLNIETVDVFLTLEESSNNRYGVLTHNYTYDCYLAGCGKGGYVVNSSLVRNCSNNVLAGACQQSSFCYRCNGSSYTTCGIAVKCFEINAKGQCVQAGFSSSQNGYCNYAKSDKKLKKNIKYVETINDLKIYEFEFKKQAIEYEKEYCDRDLSGKWRGVIAQDLEDTQWEKYVIVDVNGWLLVDYHNLPIKLEKIS